MKAVIALAFVATALAQEFVGCFDSSAVTSSGYSQQTSASAKASNEGCQTACLSNPSNAYSYYKVDSQSGTGSNADCRCSSSNPNANKVENGGSTAGTCSSTSDYVGSKLSTTFEFTKCSSSSLSFLSGTSTTTSSLAACFSACKDYKYLAIKPSTSSTYSCGCVSSISSANSATCKENNYLLYTHTDSGYVSQLPRRRLRERLAQEALIKKAICPLGLEACIVSGSEDSFECIDTTSELESCGGCVNGAFGVAAADATLGVDCTSLPGVSFGATTCTRGQCEAFSCKKGYELIGGECI